MRLINAKTITMEDFWNEVPVYVILSHTWDPEEEEVTLQEMLARKEQPAVECKKGFLKIKKACEQALLDGFTYVWVDTCCIDKTSSSELSEAINSMYKWYREAEICYAYLADVSASENPFEEGSQFRRCRWFTRGWTLQELIAPLSVVFYDKDWAEVGTKSSLRSVITQITNISKQVLLVNAYGEISIAARMSWAAKRHTTRIEDMAYCMLGIFGINMPILYGEGEGAFTRLQQEIIATSDDHTIFAWIGSKEGVGAAGLLAKSPADFNRSYHLEYLKVDKNRSPYSITNVGLSIELPLQPIAERPNQFRALLNCTIDTSQVCGIYLVKKQEGHYLRTRTKEIFTDEPENRQNYRRERIYIKEPVPSQFDVSQWMRPRINYQFHIKKLPDGQSDGFQATQFYTNPGNNYWSQTTVPRGKEFHPILTIGGSGFSGAILFERQSGLYERFIVMLGVHNYSVWCDIVIDIASSDALETVAEDYYSREESLLWDNRDRVCKKLTSYHKYVVVAVRKGVLKKSDVQFLVDINVTNVRPPNMSAGEFDGLDITPNVSAGGVGGIDTTPPNVSADEVGELESDIPWQPAYRYHINYDKDAWEAVEFPSIENIAWHLTDQSLTLDFESGGTSGIVVLRDKATNVLMAVLLGIHNWKPWLDAVPNIENAPGAAEYIWESYYYTYGHGTRNHRLWACDTDVQVLVSKNLSVRVTTTKTVENIFLTDIVRV